MLYSLYAHAYRRNPIWTPLPVKRELRSAIWVLPAVSRPFFFLRLGRALLRAAPGYLGALHGLAQHLGTVVGQAQTELGARHSGHPVVEADLLSASMSVFSGD